MLKTNLKGFFSPSNFFYMGVGEMNKIPFRKKLKDRDLKEKESGMENLKT